MDTVASAELHFTNAALVLADTVAERAALSVHGATIAAVEPEHTGAGAIDCAGDYLMPGIVDVHTDHFEKHMYPRKHVRWEALPAALAHDAQMIGAGATTAFASLTVGTAIGDPDRASILGPMIDAIDAGSAAGMFRAEHLIHLRLETSDPATVGLLKENLDRPTARAASLMDHNRPLVQVISLMDHTPGEKQNRDIEAFIVRRMAAWGKTRADVEAEIAEARARPADTVRRVRHEVANLLAPRGVAMMSHDDATRTHIDEAVAEGVSVAEFPVTLEAARAARAAGMDIVAGAPNILRGGSQSGNVAVSDLLRENLVDILASDYVPRSILDAVFQVASDPELPFSLPQTVAMATFHPARAMGLSDRGALAHGQRADLLRVGVIDGQPFLRGAWRAGTRVY